jgi:hypothetical protein
MDKFIIDYHLNGKTFSIDQVVQPGDLDGDELNDLIAKGIIVHQDEPEAAEPEKPPVTRAKKTPKK